MSKKNGNVPNMRKDSKKVSFEVKGTTCRPSLLSRSHELQDEMRQGRVFVVYVGISVGDS